MIDAFKENLKLLNDYKDFENTEKNKFIAITNASKPYPNTFLMLKERLKEYDENYNKHKEILDQNYKLIEGLENNYSEVMDFSNESSNQRPTDAHEKTLPSHDSIINENLDNDVDILGGE